MNIPKPVLQISRRCADSVASAIVALHLANLWVNARVRTGDVPGQYFEGCMARVVDMHFSTGRGPIGCFGDQWYAGLVPAIGNSLGANNPWAFLDIGALFWALVIAFGYAWIGWRLVHSTYRLIKRKPRH